MFKRCIRGALVAEVPRPESRRHHRAARVERGPLRLDVELEQRVNQDDERHEIRPAVLGRAEERRDQLLLYPGDAELRRLLDIHHICDAEAR